MPLRGLDLFGGEGIAERSDSPKDGILSRIFRRIQINIQKGFVVLDGYWGFSETSECTVASEGIQMLKD